MDLTETKCFVQVLIKHFIKKPDVSSQKEFTERQSDRQEVDLFRENTPHRQTVDQVRR